MTEARKVWLVPHPTSAFAEDVKAIARERGLIVIDEAEAGPDDRMAATTTPPKLTLIAAQKPAVKQESASGHTKKGA